MSSRCCRSAEEASIKDGKTAEQIHLNGVSPKDSMLQRLVSHYRHRQYKRKNNNGDSNATSGNSHNTSDYHHNGDDHGTHVYKRIQQWPSPGLTTTFQGQRWPTHACGSHLTMSSCASAGMSEIWIHISKDARCGMLFVHQPVSAPARQIMFVAWWREFVMCGT